jgi:hypothetical protein
MIATGYEIQSLMAETERMQRLADKALVPRSEIRKAETALQVARAQWDFAKRELMNEIEVAKVEISALERRLQANLSFLESLRDGDPKVRLQATREVQEKVQETEKEMQIATLRLRQLSERLTWMEKFEDSLDEAAAGETDTPDKNAGSLEKKDDGNASEADDTTAEANPRGRSESNDGRQGR